MAAGSQKFKADAVFSVTMCFSRIKDLFRPFLGIGSINVSLKLILLLVGTNGSKEMKFSKKRRK